MSTRDPSIPFHFTLLPFLMAIGAMLFWYYSPHHWHHASLPSALMFLIIFTNWLFAFQYWPYPVQQAPYFFVMNHFILFLPYQVSSFALTALMQILALICEIFLLWLMHRSTVKIYKPRHYGFLFFLSAILMSVALAGVGP